ncbi:MAG: S8 family peptidase [Candidatus Anammoxibacter sp.]
MPKSLNLFLFIFVSLSLLNTEIAQAGNSPIKSIKDLFIKNQILVKFKDYVPYDEKARIHKRCGSMSYMESYRNSFHLVTIKDGEVEKTINLYSENSAVKYAEPNYIVQAYLLPNDEDFKFQWNLSQINCEKAWDISTGQGIVVAIIDTGVNPNGFDGFGMNVINGRNFSFFRSGGAFDDNGHGTHVAGTVAQATNNSTGVAGIAFDASILPVKVLNRFGFGDTRALIDGIEWAAENGAHIINLSLGSDERSDILKETIKEVYDSGVVFVAAAGNESGSVGFPAAFETVIAVGSVRFDKSLSFFSNFGPEIDVVAPGGDKTVDQNSDGRPDGILQETFTRGFFRFFGDFNWDLIQLQGTSQASPHVAGVAALILAKNPMFTPDEVRNAIFRTAEDLGEPGKDDTFGWGLIDAAAALGPLPLPTPEPTVTPTPDSAPLP